MRPRLLVDTNLLVLLAVGSASVRLIETHRRTQAYSGEDFALLTRLVAGASNLVTTPHVLAETSNLSRQCAEPGRAAISLVLGRLVRAIAEIHVPGIDIVQTEHYARLGITDTALIRLQRDQLTLLTDDLDLYVQSVTVGLDAINFSHLRDRLA